MNTLPGTAEKRARNADPVQTMHIHTTSTPLTIGQRGAAHQRRGCTQGHLRRPRDSRRSVHTRARDGRNRQRQRHIHASLGAALVASGAGGTSGIQGGLHLWLREAGEKLAELQWVTVQMKFTLERGISLARRAASPASGERIRV
jgi:hypothetical protein